MKLIAIDLAGRMATIEHPDGATAQIPIAQESELSVMRRVLAMPQPPPGLGVMLGQTLPRPEKWGGGTMVVDVVFPLPDGG